MLYILELKKKELTMRIATFFLMLVTAVPAFATELVLKDAWARPTLSVHNKNGVAYITLQNNTEKEDALIGVTTPLAQKAEVHEMFEDGSTLRMRHIKALAVPAGKAVELKPGGYHIMLLGINQKLKVGEAFPMRLSFKNAGYKNVTVQVKPLY